MAAVIVSKYVNPEGLGRAVYRANDNEVQGGFRPLTEEDIYIILEEHAWSIGGAIDSCSKYQCYREDPKSALSVLLPIYPDIQRSIVWRGSSLKWQAVSKLREGHSLLEACAAVLKETIGYYESRSLEAAICEQLIPFSYFLRGVTL